MFGIGLPEFILIMALALIVVGPDKLPEMARSIAKGVMELKKTVNSLKEDLAKDNPLDEVRPQLEEAANSLKEQLGDPGPDGWTGVAGDYDIVDPHEQAINEQASTEEVVVSDIGEKDDEPDESPREKAAAPPPSSDDVPIEGVDEKRPVHGDDVAVADEADASSRERAAATPPPSDDVPIEDVDEKRPVHGDDTAVAEQPAEKQSTTTGSQRS